MSLNRPQGLRLVASDRPPEDVPLESAGYECFPTIHESECADPTLMCGRIRDLSAVTNTPALHRVILRAGEHIFAGRIKSADDRRGRVDPLLRDARLLGNGL